MGQRMSAVESSDDLTKARERLSLLEEHVEALAQAQVAQRAQQVTQETLAALREEAVATARKLQAVVETTNELRTGLDDVLANALRGVSSEQEAMGRRLLEFEHRFEGVQALGQVRGSEVQSCAWQGGAAPVKQLLCCSPSCPPPPHFVSVPGIASDPQPPPGAVNLRLGFLAAHNAGWIDRRRNCRPEAVHRHGSATVLCLGAPFRLDEVSPESVQ